MSQVIHGYSARLESELFGIIHITASSIDKIEVACSMMGLKSFNKANCVKTVVMRASAYTPLKAKATHWDDQCINLHERSKIARSNRPVVAVGQEGRVK